MHSRVAEKNPVSTKATIIIALAVIVVVMGVQFIVWPMAGLGQERYMRMYATGRTVSYDFDSGASFHSNNSRFFYIATRDRVSLVPSGGGEARWSHTFSINRPVMVARGDVVAVGEVSGGHQIYVFDSNGLMYRVVFENPVLTFSVNEAGFLSAIVQYESGYGIYIYNHLNYTNPPIFYKSIHADQFFPLSVEVCNNGNFVAIAMLDLTTRLTTSVQLRYMNQWDAWGTDGGLFSEDTFPNYMITSMRFMADNRLIVATTSQNSAQILCFRIQMGAGQSVVQQVWNINLLNTLTHLEFYGDRHFAYITGERFIGKDDADPVGTLRIVNIDGTQTGSFNLNRRASHLSMGQNAVIIGSDRNYHAIDFRGTHLWEHIVPHETRDVLFLDNTDTVLIAGANRAEVMQRRRVRLEEEEVF